MHQRPTERSRSVTTWLLIANAIAFLFQCHLYGTYPPNLARHSVVDYLALSAEGIRHGYLWQLLTFQFLHAGVMHLAMNCWVIYQFGLELEEHLGKGRFLALYLFSGTVGGVLQALLGLLVPYGQFAASVIGASAGALGLLAAFATLHPRQALSIYTPFLQARHLVLFFALWAVFGMIFPYDNLANTAHLGGLLGGTLFIRGVQDWGWRWPTFHSGRAQRMGPPIAAQNRSLRRDWQVRRERPEPSVSQEDFVSREVDPILDKISAQGIHSLTERERTILENARTRMARK